MKMGFEKNKCIAKQYNNRREQVTIGGKTFWVRSQIEKKIAMYLEMCKLSGHYKDWAHEQTKFEFNNPILKSYLVDFDVIRPDGTFFYIEAKGMMDKYSRDRITVLLTERPEVELWVVFCNRKDLLKFNRHKISRQCKRVCLLSELTRGII